MQRERNIDSDLHQVAEFPSVQHFLEVRKVPAGISTIHDRGIPIDLLVNPASAETTIFFFHGAIEEYFTLPVLSGLGISGGLEANRVFISDPSLILDEKLMLSWYAGNASQPELQRDLLAIINKIAESLNTERVVFFGGSGGGFAAMYYASYFRKSLALVFNPQTNIAEYSAGAVQEYANKAFHIRQDQANPMSCVPEDIVYDLCEHYKTGRNNLVAYMQNLHDEMHIQRHLKPFLNSVHPQTEVLILTDHWRQGHSPPPKELLSHLLNRVASSKDWQKTLCDIGFNRHIGKAL